MIIHDPFPTGRRDPGPMRGAEVSALHQRPRRSINTAPGSASGGLAALFFVLWRALKCKLVFIYTVFLVLVELISAK